MRHLIHRASLCSLVTVGLAAVSGCGDGAGGSGGAGTSTSESTGQNTTSTAASGTTTSTSSTAAGGAGSTAISGSAAKGPLILGSSIAFAPLGTDGQPTGQVFQTTTTDDSGQFAVTVGATGPASVEANGFYFNELTGNLSAAPITLRGFFEILGQPTQTVNVHVVSHIVERRARSLWLGGAMIDAARMTAESEARDQLAIGAPSFNPGFLGSTVSLLDGDNDASAYLLATSAVLVQAATTKANGGSVDAELQQLLNNISVDLEGDGTLDAANALVIHDAEAALDANAVMTNLANRFTTLGITSAVPNIARALDQDFDGASNSNDCLPLDPLRWTGHADIDSDGHDAVGCGGDDCNDNDPTIAGGMPDTVGDGIDQNCDGADGIDNDGDGLASQASGGTDCNDNDPNILSYWRSTLLAQTMDDGTIAIDSTDASHILFADTMTNQEHYVVFDASGVKTLDQAAPVSGVRGMDFDGAGHLHTTDDYETATLINGVWSTASLPSNVPSLYQLGVTPAGFAFVASTQHTTMESFLYSNATGPWAELALGDSGFFQAGAVDANGQAHICRSGEFYTVACGYYSGSPGTYHATYQGTSVIATPAMAFALGPNGAEHIFYNDQPTPSSSDAILVHAWDTGGGVFATETFTSPYGLTPIPGWTGVAPAAKAVIDASGAAHVLGSGATYFNNVGGTWKAIPLGEHSFFDSLVVDSQGVPHLVVRSSNQLFYMRGTAGCTP